MKKLFLLVLLVAAATAAGYYLLGGSGKPNVIYIVIDTLRADHVGAYGYERNTTPEIDKFAKESLKFDNALTAAPWTPASMASMFTSVYASAHAMMPPNSRLQAAQSSTKLSEDFSTIAEVFQQNGYETVGVTSNPWLQESFGYAQGFNKYVYLNRVRSDLLNAQAYKAIDELKAGGKPFFLYLHYMDPHNPYDPVPEYRDRFSEPLKKRAYPENMQRKINLYDAEIAYNDYQIGLLLKYLKDKRLYNNTAILLVSDHGEQFKERGSAGHGFNLNSEEVHVPLIVKTPHGEQQGEVADLVSLIDLYPTMLEFAGIKPPVPVQGLSLLSQRAERQKAGAMMEIRRVTNYKGHVSSENKKLINTYPLEQELILAPDTKEQASQVFDIAADPLEASALADPALQEQLSGEFKAEYGRTLKYKNKESAGEIQIDDKTLEDLKTLGYL